jgi:hypothetical protein
MVIFCRGNRTPIKSIKKVAFFTIAKVDRLLVIEAELPSLPPFGLCELAPSPRDLASGCPL